ncbi:MAG: DNA primase [Firmicutes bacterium]|nr:DNA primase [Bacillota bacterium]
MTYTFSEETIEEIREKNDIVDVISEYISLKRTGSNYKGLCPFHNEKTPSFVVSPSKQIFHCFGCNEGGDVIKFIMEYQNLDFIEALQLLAERVNINLDDKKLKRNSKEDKRRKRLFEINREAAIYFYKNLFNNKKAYNYLLNRGIDIKTIKSFGLGYAKPDWEDLKKHLKTRGFKENEISEVGLIIKRKQKEGYFDRFRDRIIFPIINTRNNVIGFGGRVLDNSQPKYLNSPDTPVFNKGKNLYGLNIIKKNKNDKILLVEGYMDVISLFKYGINYAVASLGTALTKDQAKLLNRYGKRFYICYDSDKAGQLATDKALEILYSQGIKAQVILLPESKDPDDYIKDNGKEGFNKLLEKSLDYIDFKIYYYKKIYDINTVEGSINFTKKITNLLKKIKSTIEIDVYINKIAEETNISKEAIKKEIYRNKKPYTKNREKDKYIYNNYRNNNSKEKIVPVNYTLEPGHLTAERNLINLIIKDKTIYNKIKDEIKPKDFFNNVYRKLAETIYNKYNENDDMKFDYVKDKFEKKDLEKVKETFDMENPMEGSEKIKAVRDYIDKINYYKLKLKKQDIKEKLKQYEKNESKEGDVEKFNQLCLQLISIEKQLKLHQ